MQDMNQFVDIAARDLCPGSSSGSPSASAPAPQRAPTDPNASPSEAKFINDQHAIGVYDRNGDQHMVNAGRAICSELAAGVNQGVTADLLVAASANTSANAQGGAISRVQAGDEIANAIGDLCPGAGG
jgi:hypothetical protein